MVSWKGIYFILTLFWGSFFGSIFMLGPFLPLMLVSPSWYRWINNRLVATWLTLPVVSYTLEKETIKVAQSIDFYFVRVRFSQMLDLSLSCYIRGALEFKVKQKLERKIIVLWSKISNWDIYILISKIFSLRYALNIAKYTNLKIQIEEYLYHQFCISIYFTKQWQKLRFR